MIEKSKIRIFLFYKNHIFTLLRAVKQDFPEPIQVEADVTILLNAYQTVP